MVNVTIYSIHGSYGLELVLWMSWMSLTWPDWHLERATEHSFRSCFSSCGVGFFMAASESCGILKRVHSCFFFILSTPSFWDIVIESIITAWWFGTWLLFFHILGIMIPTDELIFFRGVGIPPTSWAGCFRLMTSKKILRHQSDISCRPRAWPLRARFGPLFSTFPMPCTCRPFLMPMVMNPASSRRVSSFVAHLWFFLVRDNHRRRKNVMWLVTGYAKRMIKSTEIWWNQIWTRAAKVGNSSLHEMK